MPKTPAPSLFEKKSFPRRKVCGEYLSATSLPLLDRLGIGAAFRDLAGPPVCRVGLFAGTRVLSADLPRPAGKAEWGRALAREHLDTLLLEEAARAGAVTRPTAAIAKAARTDSRRIPGITKLRYPRFTGLIRRSGPG